MLGNWYNLLNLFPIELWHHRILLRGSLLAVFNINIINKRLRLLILWYSVGISVRHIQKGIRTWHHPLSLCCYTFRHVGKDLEHTASLKRNCYSKTKDFWNFWIICHEFQWIQWTEYEWMKLVKTGKRNNVVYFLTRDPNRQFLQSRYTPEMILEILTWQNAILASAIHWRFSCWKENLTITFCQVFVEQSTICCGTHESVTDAFVVSSTPETRMHSSRMRTVRLLTVSHSIPWGVSTQPAPIPKAPHGGKSPSPSDLWCMQKVWLDIWGVDWLRLFTF